MNGISVTLLLRRYASKDVCGIIAPYLSKADVYFIVDSLIGSQLNPRRVPEHIMEEVLKHDYANLYVYIATLNKTLRWGEDWLFEKALYCNAVRICEQFLLNQTHLRWNYYVLCMRDPKHIKLLEILIKRRSRCSNFEIWRFKLLAKDNNYQEALKLINKI